MIEHRALTRDMNGPICKGEYVEIVNDTFDTNTTVETFILRHRWVGGPELEYIYIPL